MADEKSAPQFAFVHGLGVVEVVGRGPDDLVTVRVQGAQKRHLVKAAQLGQLDCEAAKKARLQAMRAVQFRRRKTTGSE